MVDGHYKSSMCVVENQGLTDPLRQTKLDWERKIYSRLLGVEDIIHLRTTKFSRSLMESVTVPQRSEHW